MYSSLFGCTHFLIINCQCACPIRVIVVTSLHSVCLSVCVCLSVRMTFQIFHHILIWKHAPNGSTLCFAGFLKISPDFREKASQSWPVKLSMGTATIGGRGGIKISQRTISSGDSKYLILVHTVQLKPMIKALPQEEWSVVV